MNGAWSPGIHRLIKTFLLSTVGLYFRLRYRLKAENLEELKNTPGPYLILPNHVMTWDPVLISMFIPDPIYFVSSDANFRGPKASRWLRRMGTIPTSKRATDFTTLRRIIETLKAGGHIALFPEGERTWDGITLPIVPSTAKLARLVGAPVVVPVIKGAYQSRPRWDYRTRPGPVTVEYKVAITRDELKGMELQEIQNRIERAIYHDDHEYQRLRQATYRSRKPAEPLQAILFTCPECRGLNTMYSKGDRFFCRTCGWETRFTPRGLFEKIDPHRQYFDNIRRWNLWQQEDLKTRLAEVLKNADTAPLFWDRPAVYYTGYKFKTQEERARGLISLNIRGITFTPNGNTPPIEFAWKDLSALNVVYQSQIEFYHQKILHSFTFPGKDISGYKYLCAGRLLQEQAGGFPDE